MYACLALAAAYYVLHKFQSPQISRKSLNNKRLGQEFRHWTKTRETTPLFSKIQDSTVTIWQIIFDLSLMLESCWKSSYLPRQKSKQSSQCLLITEKILLSETQKFEDSTVTIWQIFFDLSLIHLETTESFSRQKK